MNEQRPAPRLAQELTVRIPGRPPTANARRHWHAIAKDNETWKHTTMISAGWAKHDWEARHGLKWAPLRHADVRVTFGLASRRAHDLDNLIGSIKPELDGIVAAGILIDDSIRVIRSVSFGWTLSKNDPYTEFEIVEVPE